MDSVNYILIVEDSITVAIDLQDLFEGSGYKVILSKTLSEARTALATKAIHLILLDVILPDGDGISFLRELKKVAKFSELPVMILSSQSEVKDRLLGISTGAIEYVGKPYDRSYLLGKANELLKSGDGTPDTKSGAHVLVIDDSATFRESMKDLLEKAGFIPVLADSGEEGIKLASRIHPDALIIDGMLPGIDGPTVVRRIRSDSYLRDTPCIILTESTNTQDEFLALESGSDAHIRKSEDGMVILARLKALLRASIPNKSIRSSASMLAPKRILAVDDSLTCLAAIVDPLREEGYDVVSVTGGRDALALLEAQRVDCVLLDMMMPDLSGHDTCRNIKSAEKLKSIPVIMLTSREDQDAILESFNAGADDYILKSNEFVVLKARIRAQLRRSQFEEENRLIREDLAHKEIEAIESQASRQLAEQRGVLLNQLEKANQDLQLSNEELKRQRATLESEKEKLKTLTNELEIVRNEALDKAREAQKATQYKSEFLANMSHELRTPLNAIMALSQLMVENTSKNLTDQQVQNVKTIYSSGSDLLTLINDILDLSKVEAGKFEIFPGECAVSHFVKRLEELFSLQTSLKKLEFSVVVSEDVPQTFQSDFKRIEQILRNLVSNAIKFTEKGKVQVLFFSPAQSSSIDPGETVRPVLGVSVKDSGIGIPKDKQESIFQEFIQVDSSITRKYQGTGLGLAISLNLAKRLGGKIALESQPGKGSTFTLYLPDYSSISSNKTSSKTETSSHVSSVEVGKKSRQEAEKERVPQVSSGTKILIADDDIRNIYVFRQVLYPTGAEVVIAQNGKEAVQILDIEPRIDLVLMDINMPEMNGIEAIRAIREKPKFKKLPIIAITAKAMKKDEQECLDAGASMFLTKPIEINQLYSLIKEWLCSEKQSKLV